MILNKYFLENPSSIKHHNSPSITNSKPSIVIPRAAASRHGIQHCQYPSPRTAPFGGFRQTGAFNPTAIITSYHPSQ